MDHTTEHQHYQQYYQQYQPQPQAAEAYDPSQLQPYYAYDHHHQQQQQYYSSQHYASACYPQQFHQESASVHPPGVPVPPDTLHFQNHQNAYYSHGVTDNQSNFTQFAGTPNMDAPQWSTHPRIGQSAYRGGSRNDGRPFRRGRGRDPKPDNQGRGQGGGSYFPSHGAASNSTPSASVPGQIPSTVPAQVPPATWPPPRMAWCELCRVDCNTPEILEQHKNGKRHKKNLQTHADLFNKVITQQQNVQIPNSGSQPELIQPQKVQRSEEKQAPEQSLPSQALTDDNNIETELHKDVVENSKVHTEDSAAEPQRKSRDQFDGRNRGFKRKMRGGRGGKYRRPNEGPRQPVEPAKPKEVIPFICELCNVRCESQVVFDSHLAGKKHLMNVKRFHGHRALYGEAGLQALYPPNFNTSSSSVIPQVQHGVSDPQVVLAQLLTYVLSQTQAPGLLAAQVPGLLAAQVSGVPATVAPAPAPAPGSSQDIKYQHNPETQGSMAISEVGIKGNITTEAEGQQESIATEPDAPVDVIIDTKAENGSSALEEKSCLSGDNLVTTSVINEEQVLSEIS
ncbi:uncharacterized protein LOC116128162 [Pistacia vera]|uniref:uncharacterized protein LOC116128162 n=1 Tax=Pistacia vera TaxID=55513 RepID=UPI001263CB2D|nr:uncharacterized protein LOC116128162 [Pistacia vera]